MTKTKKIKAWAVMNVRNNKIKSVHRTRNLAREREDYDCYSPDELKVIQVTISYHLPAIINKKK